MNYKKLGKILGKIMVMEGALMFAPLIVTFFYKESFINVMAFLIPIILLTGIKILLLMKKKKNMFFLQK